MFKFPGLPKTLYAIKCSDPKKCKYCCNQPIHFMYEVWSKFCYTKGTAQILCNKLIEKSSISHSIITYTIQESLVEESQDWDS